MSSIIFEIDRCGDYEKDVICYNSKMVLSKNLHGCRVRGFLEYYYDYEMHFKIPYGTCLTSSTFSSNILNGSLIILRRRSRGGSLVFHKFLGLVIICVLK